MWLAAMGLFLLFFRRQNLDNFVERSSLNTRQPSKCIIS
jgi:hypothetical protein